MAKVKRDAGSLRMRCPSCDAEIVLYSDAVNSPPKKCFKCKGTLKGAESLPQSPPDES
jgi:ribosomal protein S27E